MGTLNTTVSGRTCQMWSSNTPHTPLKYFTDDRFPDGSRTAAKNYCRNPYGSKFNGVWCYTTDPYKRWEECDVPICGNYRRERFDGECRHFSSTHAFQHDSCNTHSWLAL